MNGYDLNEMNGYDLAEEIFNNIGLSENHDISIHDAIRVISFFGFNDSASKTSKIGFVCYCARDKIKEIFEKALVYNDFSLFDDLVQHVQIERTK